MAGSQPGQLAEERAGRRDPLVAVLAQASLDQGRELAVLEHRIVVACQHRRIELADRFELDRVQRSERMMTGDQLVENDTDGPQVGFVIDLAAGDLLR